MIVTFPSTHEYAHIANSVSKGMRYAVVTWMAAVGTARVLPTPSTRMQNRSWHQLSDGEPESSRRSNGFVVANRAARETTANKLG